MINIRLSCVHLGGQGVLDLGMAERKSVDHSVRTKRRTINIAREAGHCQSARCLSGLIVDDTASL